MQGYARLNKAEAALDAMREFWQQGGEPDDGMFEVLVNLCVRTGEFRKALQVCSTTVLVMYWLFLLLLCLVMFTLLFVLGNHYNNHSDLS